MLNNEQRGIGVSKGRSFYSCDNPNHSGITNTWFTPKKILDCLGDFDLDPCTQSIKPFDVAKKHYCYDLGQDGLTLPWKGRVFLNPPYGKHTPKWLDKLKSHGNGIALVFNALETIWGQKHAYYSDAVFMIAGRISFIDQNLNKRNNAGKGSVLIIYGQNNAEIVAKSALKGILLATK